MAHVTGSASSYANLLSSIQSALTANGWTLTSGVLIKSGLHVLLKVANPFASGTQSALIASIGNSSSAGVLTGNPAPNGIRVGPFSSTTTAGDMTFPCTYRIFINTSPDEVYIFCRYGTNQYQWVGFGVSPAVGSSGNGSWLSGTFGNPPTGSTASPNNALGTNQAFYITNSGNASSNNAVAPGPFMSNLALAGVTFPGTNSIMHTGTATANGWSAPNGTSEIPNAYVAVAGLLAISPNAWNSQAALINILVSIPAASNKTQIVGNIAHCRYVKINFMQPEDIIILGSDKWMVFPLFKKGTSELNASRDDTGYYGVALRYDGP